ncbi:sensor histidine kinase [Cupriavidus plantarum]|uniref:sensor histidine kinase n=1 Tax=Cupriavidus plantarum TaxID=942865 RepID=UPI001FD55E17|nr:HAMP domain-containing sensor histidine kinase [Cupriavidus plantarum]SMR85658.1 two-component system, LuxR family, sensor kinase FixL [Cupriavidus plantarum]
MRRSSAWMLYIAAVLGAGCAILMQPPRAGRRVPREGMPREPWRPREPVRMTLRGPLAEMLPQSGIAELAGSLAHELNQPLTAITSNAHAAREFLAASEFNKELLKEIVDDMVDDASRASDIVRGVRALVLGEAPRMVPFNVADVVEQALDLARANATARCVAIERDIPEALPRAVGDPVEIRLVLLNLLVNALDAVASGRSSHDRRITVRARALDHEVRMAVQDNGAGVAADDLDKIFRPFYSSKPKGMGVGLSLSRALMERNGGHIQAIRNSGGGMTFECVLPQEALTLCHRTTGTAVFQWR